MLSPLVGKVRVEVKGKLGATTLVSSASTVRDVRKEKRDHALVKVENRKHCKHFITSLIFGNLCVLSTLPDNYRTTF